SDQRSLWHQHLLLRLVGLDRDPDKLSIDQSAIRIRHGRAHDYGIRRAIHRHIDKVYSTRLVVGRAVRKPYAYGKSLLPCLARLLLLHLQELTLADGKRHIHRIAADDHGERTAVGTDDVACCQFGTPDLPGDR